MKRVDYIPVITVMIALMVNVLIGISGGIGFTSLMIRCIFVTVVFALIGYIVAEVLKGIMQLSSTDQKRKIKEAEAFSDETVAKNNGNNSILDIKVPPLDYEELSSLDDDSNSEFLEVNPALMGSYKQDKQDNNM